MFTGYAQDVKTSPLSRIPTRKPEIDWLFGCSTFSTGYLWGMPVGKISLMSGARGVGKSRAMIEISKSLCCSKGGNGVPYSVLYFPLEQGAEEIVKGFKDDGSVLPRNFYISEQNSMNKQIEIIKSFNPNVVFIDSINKLIEYSSCSDNKINEIVEAYQKVAKEYRVHIVFVSMLSKDGETKGSTTLPHLVDMEFYIMKSKRVLEEYGLNHFEIRLGEKNRCGPAGKEYYSVWKHYDKKADVVSNNREKNKRWVENHGRVYVEPYVPNELLKSLGFTDRPKYTEFYKRLHASPKLMDTTRIEDVAKMVDDGEIIDDVTGPMAPPAREWTTGERIADWIGYYGKKLFGG